MKLREDERFRDDFEADDIAVHGILHGILHGGDYSSITDGPKRSGRKVFQTLATRCAGIQDKWEYRNRAISLSQKFHYKDEHLLIFQEYTSQWQKIFHLYYLAGEELSEGLKMAWCLDGLKAEDGSTVSTSKSAMISEPAYSEFLNKAISRLTMDISEKKVTGKNNNRNCNKRNNKYIKEVIAKQTAELEAKFEQK